MLPNIGAAAPGKVPRALLEGAVQPVVGNQKFYGTFVSLSEISLLQRQNKLTLVII